MFNFLAGPAHMLSELKYGIFVVVGDSVPVLVTSNI